MQGIHHVTAIAGDPVANLSFYTRTLGMRLVKKTVNFDDPSTYHLYYGDEGGGPGTILTFFPWAHAAPGRSGAGLTQTTSFRVPARSIDAWKRRFVALNVRHEAPTERFGETVLPFSDPHGMSLALVGVTGAEAEPAWSTGDIPTEHAVRGFHGVTLLLEEASPTAAILSDVLGFSDVGREGAYVRLKAQAARGGIVDIHEAAAVPHGRMGRGSVHHIAFRARDDAEQTEMARKLAENHGQHSTEQMDRNYFRSIYFREPGGILFEIATDAPGFAVDEPLAELGRGLKLPKFLEPRRAELEAVLPVLDTVA